MPTLAQPVAAIHLGNGIVKKHLKQVTAPNVSFKSSEDFEDFESMIEKSPDNTLFYFELDHCILTALRHHGVILIFDD